MTPPLPTQPTPTAREQPDAAARSERFTGLYESPRDALKSIADGYSYWTGKLTESSFALSLAVIGANWAVFGSFDKVRNNIWAEWSIAVVLLTLVINLIGHWYLGEQLRKQIEHAEKNLPGWQKEFNNNVGKSTPWPSTKRIDNWAWVFRLAKMSLPMLGGAFFVIAFFTQPKAESHSYSSASQTPRALSSPSATASIVGPQPPSQLQKQVSPSKPIPTRELDDVESAKIRHWVENAHKRGEEWGKESPKPSPSVTEARQLQSQPKTPK